MKNRNFRDRCCLLFRHKKTLGSYKLAKGCFVRLNRLKE